MGVYKVKRNQNLFDVALHLYGSIEGVFDLLISNDELGMDTKLHEGDELKYHESFVINSGIVKAMEAKGIVPANGERNSHYKPTNQPIVFISNTNPLMPYARIKVSGSGTMIVDWGDNSDLEEIPLTTSVTDREHYFNNEVEKRRVSVYGNFQLIEFDTSELGGALLMMRPLTVDEYTSKANGFDLDGLFLFEGTYKVNLQKCEIHDLSPIGDMSLQELDLRKAVFDSVSVIDDYLEHIVSNYGNRRNCRVYLDTTPSQRGIDAIKKIINEPSWNLSGKWEFIINGVTY